MKLLDWLAGAVRISILGLVVVSTLSGCGDGESVANGGTKGKPAADAGVEIIPLSNDLHFNEVVSNNEGVWIDELGEADDYLEIINASSASIDLGQYTISDSKTSVSLPSVNLDPNQIQLLWADDSPAQSPIHLGFKISSKGEVLTLRRGDGVLVDRVEVPALAEHHAYVRMPDGTGEFADCGWASPTRLNGERCGPPPVPELPESTTFAPYTWPSPWPALPQPLVFTELALRPASFVELLNTGDSSVELSQYQVTIAAHSAGHAWPSSADGSPLAWPTATLGAHERVVLPVSDETMAAVAATASFEGVVTLWSIADAIAIDRKDFSYYPDNTTLARVPDPDGPFQYCGQSSPGVSNDNCQPLPGRAIGDHLRNLSTPSDFTVLSAGRGNVGAAAVEFVVDMDSGDVVSLLNSANWDLHFIFINEVIDGQPHIDRCTEEGMNLFNTVWRTFSDEQYFLVEGRRYLLGNLVKYAGTDIQTVEFTPGDSISPEQMLHAFHAVLRHVDDPTRWTLRPQSPRQILLMQEIEGQVPIVEMNAPFRDLTYQPLVPTVGYGTLRFVPADSINEADIGPRDIVVTDQVPLNIPYIGGLITETFQTPLSHVNVLSRGRGTPNMGLRDARDNPRLQPLFGKLVRLEIGASDFTIKEANSEDAVTYWESRKPSGPALLPRMDTSVRGIQPLSDRSIDDIPSIGGKAAQLAELGRVTLCALNATSVAAARIPLNSFAIPLVHSIEHLQKSGAEARLSQLRLDPAFSADPKIREQGLAAVQADILATPIDPELLAAVRAQIARNWPGQRVRFRSSSNTEDLPNFNGAGLYTSIGIDASASDEEISTTIRSVWASLWRLRAYDEREYYNIDHSSVAMAVLVQEAFPSEKANGVAISRNILVPENADRYYINAQVGEALVTNPAPGIVSDQFTYALRRTPHIVMQSQSSFNQGVPVLSDTEASLVACSLQQIHEHFQPILDPDELNPWFAMDIEFKFIGPSRQLVIKQARPYSFGQEAPSGWCDFE